MSLFFTTCGTLFILFLFNLLNFILKPNKLNKWIISLFFLLLCVFDCFANFSFLNMELNANFILLLVTFLMFFVMLKTPKNYILTILSCLIVVAVLIGYSALDLTQFELLYIKPHFVLAIIVSFVLKFVVKDTKSMFCGTFLGTLIFELTSFRLSLSYTDKMLVLGSNFAIEFVVYSFIFYMLFTALMFYFKKLQSLIIKQKIKT